MELDLHLQMYSTSVDIALALSYAKLFREHVIVIVNEHRQNEKVTLTIAVSGVPTALVYVSPL